MVTDEFLSSEEEQSAWHEGIYYGLKTLSPVTLYRRLESTGTNFSEWEDREGHYRDTVMVATWCLKYVALGVGTYYGFKIAPFLVGV